MSAEASMPSIRVSPKNQSDRGCGQARYKAYNDDQGLDFTALDESVEEWKYRPQDAELHEPF